MFVQRVILDYNNQVKDLFVRHSNNQQSFDTFFNSLNLYLVKQFTDCKSLTIFCESDGKGFVKVIHETKERVSVLFEAETVPQEIKIDLTSLSYEGIIYPIFSGSISIKSMRYEVDAVSKKIHTAAIFTTFNRQEFLIPNLYKLNTCNSIDKVIIVDNAKNVELPADLPRDKFIIVPNDNLGGTGGFTRGMIEAKKTGASHIFIMDDDITLIPEVIDKALSLISSLKPSHENDWLGFSMLPNGSPTTQYELGTKWNGIKMCLNNHMLDVSKKESLFKNQINTKYNYSAWWSLIMPISVIDKYGYPFPFFIKFDDIEYALRRTGEEIILTNGFAVWHEDFDKKYNPYLEYYLYRNALVTNSLHDKKPKFHSLIRYLGKTVKAYFKGKFIVPKLMNIAVNDFLKGPDFFKTLDIEALNKEIRLIADKKIKVLDGIFTYPFRIIHNFFKLTFGFNKAKKKYINEFGYFTNLEYWEGVFKNGR